MKCRHEAKAHWLHADDTVCDYLCETTRMYGHNFDILQPEENGQAFNRLMPIPHPAHKRNNLFGPCISATGDVFWGRDYERLWYRARCWFHKRAGLDIPN